MDNGIYFNLSEDEYFNENRLSSTDIRNLLKSPTEYWLNSNFNPLKEEKKSQVKFEGKLYHCLILEPENFDKKYKIIPEGLTGNSKEAKMWRSIQGLNHDLVNNKLYNDVKKNISYLKQHGQLLDCSIFKDGFPEVSIFWEYEGIPCKSRIDYLTITRLIDLKTFSKQGCDIDKFVAQYFFIYKVYVQLYFYTLAANFAKRLRIDQVHGNSDQIEFWREWTAQENINQMVVFLNRSMPQFRVKTFFKAVCPDMYRLAESEIKKAIEIYKKYSIDKGFFNIWMEELNTDNLTFTDADFPQTFSQILELQE